MAGLQEYKCPCCGAALQFGAEEQQMRCEYCENTFTLEALEACQASAKAEPDTFDWTNDSRAWTQADQESMQAFHCPSCGGEILTEARGAGGLPTLLPWETSAAQALCHHPAAGEDHRDVCTLLDL